MKQSINVLGKEYSITKSKNGNYYVDPKIYVDLHIYDSKKFAGKFGKLSPASIPSFIFWYDFSVFIKYLESLNNCPNYFWTIVPVDLFVQNLNASILPNTSGVDILKRSFIWGKTEQGHDFWKNIHDKLIDYENQLQGKKTDRSRENRSEGNRLCSRRNKSQSSTGHCCYKARARKGKENFGHCKIVISS